MFGRFELHLGDLIFEDLRRGGTIMPLSDSKPTSTEGSYCTHVVGIGRTGAVYVEALLRTGEIEDLLVDPSARFAALVVDVGEEDMGIAMDYGAAFVKRLESRDIPAARFHFKALSLPGPSDELVAMMVQSKDVLKASPSAIYSDPGIDGTAADATLLLGHGPHLARAAAKAVYAEACYAGDRPLSTALDDFVSHVKESSLPSIVTLCFALAGGTGGGMSVDMARNLAARLGPDVAVVGIGQLPSSGDPAELQASPTLYVTLTEIDCMLDEEKNAALVERWGESYRSPFTGGFFVVNPEQSWQRLTAYTTTGEKAIRQGFKQMVTNRFVADSVMRLAVTGTGRDLIKAMKPVIEDEVGGKKGRWALFDVAKLTHPGVQVLPGEAPSKWAAVIQQWIDFVPKYAGLSDGFKTSQAEVFVYGSRHMGQEVMQDEFRKMLSETYLAGDNATVKVFMREFFDTLTAYANVVLPGVAKTDLLAFHASLESYTATSPARRLEELAWLIDPDATLPEATAPLEAMRGRAVWGCSGWHEMSGVAL